MEESRIDPYQIVGFLLLIACAFYVFNMSPQPVENINENNSENQIESSSTVTTELNDNSLVLNDNDIIVHFGDKRYEDFTQHKDKKRQTNYCLRASGIRDKKGKLTKNNINSPNYYSMRVLWSCDKRKDLKLGLK